MLEASTDDRAPQLLAQTGRVPDIEGAAVLLAPSARPPTEDGRLEILKRLASLQLPAEEEVATAADRLTEAARVAEEAAATDAGHAREVARLLDEAVAFHQRHGDSDCPVCGNAQGLSAAWRAHADMERTRLRAEAKVADDAHAELVRAVAAAGALLHPPPPALAAAASVGIDASAVLVDWQAWAAGPADDAPTELATHVSGVARWRRHALIVKREAEKHLLDVEDAWRPISQAGLVWLEHARADRLGAMRVKDLKAAETWLKKAGEEIRAERFVPLAARATEVWKTRRQRSSVDIGGITLAGSTTTRRVKVDVSVHGSDGAARAVMSQGELHALALALFFPRATLPESPFRFIVIDDPAPGNGPGQVEGLARVLEQTATGHQVIVLTHDDRLPEAVRRLRIPATIVEVDRDPDRWF